MRFSKVNLIKIRKRIEKNIQDRRNTFEIRHMQDLLEKQKKLPFVKEIIVDSNIALVKLKGVVDSSTIPLMKQGRRRQLTGQRHIILDFKDVKHIDSTTLGQLTMLFLELKAHNKKLAILNASPVLRDYIVLLKLSSIVKTYDTKKEAVSALT